MIKGDTRHPYIDTFRDAEKKADFRNCHSIQEKVMCYAQAYTGNKRNLEDLLSLVCSSLEEIFKGVYEEKDTEDLFLHLKELEEEIVYTNFTPPISSLGVPPILAFLSGRFSGIGKKYIPEKRDRYQPQKILIPISQLRNLQYEQALYKQLQRECKNLRRILEDNENKSRIEWSELYEETILLRRKCDVLSKEVEQLKYQVPQQFKKRRSDDDIVKEVFINCGLAPHRHGVVYRDGRKLINDKNGYRSPTPEEERLFFGNPKT